MYLTTANTSEFDILTQIQTIHSTNASSVTI